VVFPFRVDHVQKDHALEAAQLIRADFVFFGFVCRFRPLDQRIGELVARVVFEVIE
jgi:hypothetical protein